MLSNYDYKQWCYKLKISPEAENLVVTIRTSPPSITVSSGRKNVSGRYPSKKMKKTIQFKRHRLELPIIYELEHDENVQEYYDYPPRIRLEYNNAGNNKKVSYYYSPSFFVIRNNSAEWLDCKYEEQLLKLSKTSPEKYLKNDDGSWICPPGEQYAKQYGFRYRVISSKDINWILQRNLVFLEDYLVKEHMDVSSQFKNLVLDTIKKIPGITISGLISKLGITNTDQLYTLIAKNIIYVDLSMFTLANPEEVPVFENKEIANAYFNINNFYPAANYHCPVLELEVGTKVNWDGTVWFIANIGEKSVSIFSENNDITHIPLQTFETLLKQKAIIINEVGTKRQNIQNEIVKEHFLKANPRELAEANSRYNAILPLLKGRANQTSIPDRTLRNWLKQYKTAEKNYGNGYIGLIPKHHKKGNYNKKMQAAVYDLMESIIEEEYEILTQPTKRSVYGKLIIACENKGLTTPSFKTFSTAINNRSIYQSTKKRKGPKAAYNYKTFYWHLHQSTPHHGDRPFEAAHIDHTKLDIELVSSITGENLGRPYLTFMVDAYSRRILAFYLTFDPPSYRSCMMVMRECVRRFNRLPETIIVDGGKEFHSTYFESFLAIYMCIKKTRPAGDSRSGNVIERLFGTTNTQFLYNLLGNTQPTKNVRELTKEINPKTQAVWTLKDLYHFLSKWLDDIYDTTVHPALGQSPQDMFISGQNLTGKRSLRVIPYDDVFIMSTFPTTRKGTAKVKPGRGIKVNNRYYWSDVFRNPEVENTQVPVRYDPFNSGKAYAYVQKQWNECISEYYAVFKNRTEKEIQIAVQELKKQDGNRSSNFSLTTKKLAEFLLTVKHTEKKLQLQRLRDKESKMVAEPIKSEDNNILSFKALRDNEIQTSSLPFDSSELKIFEEY